MNSDPVAEVSPVPSGAIIAICHPGHSVPSTCTKKMNDPSGDQLGWVESEPLAVPLRIVVVAGVIHRKLNHSQGRDRDGWHMRTG